MGYINKTLLKKRILGSRRAESAGLTRVSDAYLNKLEVGLHRGPFLIPPSGIWLTRRSPFLVTLHCRIPSARRWSGTRKLWRLRSKRPVAAIWKRCWPIWLLMMARLLCITCGKAPAILQVQNWRNSWQWFTICSLGLIKYRQLMKPSLCLKRTVSQYRSKNTHKKISGRVPLARHEAA